MSDFITVLTTASGADLGKSFSGPNLKPLRFQTSKHFTAEELEVHDLSSLIDVLQSLEGEPTKTVIRGKVLSDASRIISRDKETIVASPRSWCMLDIDGLFWDGPNDHEAMLKRIRRKGKTIALESANRNYETKIFGPDRVKVQGVLVSLYRNF